MYTVAKVWNQSSENCLVGKYAFVLVSKNANKKDFYNNIVGGITRSLIMRSYIHRYILIVIVHFGHCTFFRFSSGEVSTLVDCHLPTYKSDIFQKNQNSQF